MAMLPQIFTLNGLATETGFDRRRVGRLLASTTPDGELNGKPAWRLATFLRTHAAEENRGHGEPANEAAIARLEYAARQVDALLDELRAESSIKARRRLIQSGRGGVVGAFVDAFEASRAGLSDNALTVTQPLRRPNLRRGDC
jgi:hypothetical protein